MSSWIEVGKTGELVKGAMKEVLIKDKKYFWSGLATITTLPTTAAHTWEGSCHGAGLMIL